MSNKRENDIGEEDIDLNGGTVDGALPPDLNQATVDDVPAPDLNRATVDAAEPDLNGATVDGADVPAHSGQTTMGVTDLSAKTFVADNSQDTPGFNTNVNEKSPVDLEGMTITDVPSGNDAPPVDLGGMTIVDSPASGEPPIDLGGKTITDQPPVDLGGMTITDAPSGNDAPPVDLGGMTIVDSPASGELLIDLGGKTITDQPSVDLGGQTITDSDNIDFGAATLADGGISLSAQTLNTIDRDVQQQWMATIQQGYKETMTIKGEDLQEKKSGKKSPTVSPNKSTHINVNTRTVADITKKSKFEGNITVKKREVAGAAGSSLVDYELQKVLGEGGMGIVYQARQTSIDRSIAIKMIKGQAIHDPAARNKFLSEAAVTGDLDHPNIVPIHDLGDDGTGALFYAMKHVKGKPWDEEVRDLSLGRNLEILKDVGEAIRFAHDRGIVHRDLKPENVMLGGYGEVLVMDWGLAAAYNDKGKASRITAKTSVCGTPAYMSPEMAIGDGTKIDPRSDIYLLGAMLFEIITGYAPHTGQTVLQCLESAALNRIRDYDDNVELRELMDVALRAMSTESEDRYKSVMDFQAAIDSYLSHTESISLSKRAGEDLDNALSSLDYDDFSKSIFAYQESIRLWGDNTDAHEGLSRARLSYANCAFEKGDLDLAENQLVEMTEPFLQLRNKVVTERADREKRQRFLVYARYAVLTLVGIVLVGSLGAGITIYRGSKEIEAKAIAANKAEKEAKKEAERAKAAEKDANSQKEQADKARREAELAKDDALIAKAEAEKAKEAAQRAADEAKQNLLKAQVADMRRRLEEARNEKLRDYKRWALDKEQAVAAQKVAAQKKGLEVLREIPLGKPNVKLKMALIPDGRFTMGSPSTEFGRKPNESLHDVQISKPFYMGVYEVTQRQWQAVVGGKNPSSFQGSDVVPRHPVENVSYEDIVKKFLPAMQKFAPDGFIFDLPTEAEWEYSCRAGTATAYYGTDNPNELGKYAWFGGKIGNSRNRTHYTGKKDGSANAWGLFDMHGNVAEICRDTYDSDYYLKEVQAILDKVKDDDEMIQTGKVDRKKVFLPIVTDPLNTAQSDYVVVRGGSWYFKPEHCRSAYRSSMKPDRRTAFAGFRLVLRKK